MKQVRRQQDAIERPHVTKPAIRRLARRAGVKRLNGLVYEETRENVKTFLERTLEKAYIYTQHRKASTVSVGDVLEAFRQQNRPIYGFGDTVQRGGGPSKARRTGGSNSTMTPSLVGAVFSPPAVSTPPAAVFSPPAAVSTPPAAVFSPPQAEDYFFGDLAALLRTLQAKRDTVTEIQVLTGPDLDRTNLEAWWKATAHIRRLEPGCPRLNLQTLRGAMVEEEYHIYNVRGILPGRNAEGILAFLILKQLDDSTVEIDYACAFQKVPGLMMPLIRALKHRHDMYLKAIIDPAAVSFWYRAGFRTHSPEVNAFLQTRAGDFRVSDLMTVVETYLPDQDDSGTLEMVYDAY